MKMCFNHIHFSVYFASLFTLSKHRRGVRQVVARWPGKARASPPLREATFSTHIRRVSNSKHGLLARNIVWGDQLGSGVINTRNRHGKNNREATGDECPRRARLLQTSAVSSANWEPTSRFNGCIGNRILKLDWHSGILALRKKNSGRAILPSTWAKISHWYQNLDGPTKYYFREHVV